MKTFSEYKEQLTEGKAMRWQDLNPHIQASLDAASIDSENAKIEKVNEFTLVYPPKGHLIRQQLSILARGERFISVSTELWGNKGLRIMFKDLPHDEDDY